MRIALISVACLAFVGAGCGGSSGKQTVSTDTTTSASATSNGPATTTTTLELPTTSLPCQSIPVPTTPVTSPTAAASSLLTGVQELGDACVDHVIFDFSAQGTDPPGYTITYGSPPFNNTASDKPTPVAGSAFVVVTVKPGYGYDFATGKATYTGPKSVPVGATNHVKAIVETGDFEGVLNWVIGLDSKRPFSVQATGTPRHQLVVTIS